MSDVREVLQHTFGFLGFREGQQAVIERLLAGHSVLAVFPTGGGKSLCYQLPAMLLDGLTLVVSPLIALMKDQLDFLTARHVPAARLDSTLTADEARAVYRRLHAGQLKLLYVSPERLANERFLQTLRALKIAMLAVDEAHCVSEWGHNFRPDYLKLGQLARELNVGRILALTATAPPSVADDIARAFAVKPADQVRTGFYRPNLTLRLTPCRPGEAAMLLRRRLDDRPRGATIVYVTLQRTAEEVAWMLTSKGTPARAYHAGLDAEVRHQIQDWFMESSNAVVVATIAFGMGIDKSNIRYVYHFNLPKSLENYGQEVGRAGRDGLESVCEAFICPEDCVALENFTFGDTPTPDAVTALVQSLTKRGPAFDVSTYDLANEYDIRPLVVETLLTYLELEGVIAATGPFFREYKFQPLKPSADILAKFDGPRAEFLGKLFRRAKKAKTWFNLDVPAAAKALGEPRGRIVAALNYLEEQGDLTLKVSGASIGYRLVKPPADAKKLGARLAERFVEREKRDVERLAMVLNLSQHPGCWSRKLAAYFGDPPGTDCGHCGWCQGDRPGPLPPPSWPAIGDAERALVRSLRAEMHDALATPRQMARFLCGLSSPATAKAKLTKHPAFGRLAAMPFAEVLKLTEGA
ncbi:MAG: ATP-dependent DNA helicase RecQ [Gemmataceae bacterium]